MLVGIFASVIYDCSYCFDILSSNLFKSGYFSLSSDEDEDEDEELESELELDDFPELYIEFNLDIKSSGWFSSRISYVLSTTTYTGATFTLASTI